MPYASYDATNKCVYDPAEQFNPEKTQKTNIKKEQVLKGLIDMDKLPPGEGQEILNSMSQEEQQQFMMMENCKPIKKLVLRILGPDEPEEGAIKRRDLWTVQVYPSCTSMTLRKLIAAHYDMDPFQLVLHYQNITGNYTKRPELLTEDYDMSGQAVRTGALIICKRMDYNTIESKAAKSSYYMNKSPDVPEEIRYQPAGVPAKLEAPQVKRFDQLQLDKENVTKKNSGYAAPNLISAAPGIPCVKIAHWAFVDDGKNVKIYIDAEKEPEVVKAAESPMTGTIEAAFRDKGFTLVVLGDGKKHLLDFDDLEDEIVPADCRTRVSAGKRVTVTLRKKDTSNTWYTLIRPK